MDVNKYNEQYYNNKQFWNQSALHLNDEQLKGTICTSYLSTERFVSIQPTLLQRGLIVNTLLDFGCGIGRNFSAFSEISHKIYAYDVPNMLDRCKQCHDGKEYKYKYIYNFDDIEKNKYDIIFDIQTLQTFGDVKAVQDCLIKFYETTDLLYILTRSYIDDCNKTNILDIINDSKLFVVSDSTVVPDLFAAFKPNQEQHAEILLKKVNKTTVSVQNNISSTDKDHHDVVFLDESYTFYTGGKYYDTMIALAITKCGRNVSMYNTLQDFIIGDNFYDYKQPDISYGLIKDVDIHANIYFGGPYIGNMQALKLGAKYNKPVFLIVYDCPLWHNDICPRYFSESEMTIYEKISDTIKRYIKDIPKLTILTLTKNSIPAWSKWFDLPIDNFVCLQPFVNSVVIDAIPKLPKENYITVISRNCWNKYITESIDMFRNFSDDYILNIVTNNHKSLYAYIDQIGLDKSKIHMHTNITDIHKFFLLKQSKLLISNSRFEGFGMWSIEALSCGTPVICYDLDSLKSIVNPHIHKIQQYDTKKFSDKMQEVLDTNEVVQPYTQYGFSIGVQRVQELLDTRV